MEGQRSIVLALMEEWQLKRLLQRVDDSIQLGRILGDDSPEPSLYQLKTQILVEQQLREEESKQDSSSQ